MKFTKQNGYYQQNRNRQSKYWMYESINEALRESFYRNERIENEIERYEQLVLANQKSSFVAAKELLTLYFDSIKR